MYNYITMTTSETIISIVVSVSTILTSLILGVKWLVKHYFDEIKHELKPNSGKSLKDQVNRMEQDICDIKKENEKGEEAHVRLDNKIDHLTQMFVEYLSRQK